jgi:hypothetical protein
MLAEIADKMATIPQMWLYWGLAGIVLVTLGVVHRRIAIVMFIAGVIVSIFLAWFAYEEAFLAPDLSRSIKEELGSIWIVHSLVSSFCPAIFTGIVLFWHLKKRKVSSPK